MFGHWYVVASQKSARIFSEIPTSEGESRRLKTLKTFENPLSKVKTRDLIHQESGVGVKSLGHFGSSARYAETKRRDPHEEAAVQFAKKVAAYLVKQKLGQQFTELTIVAEPNFLGKIRAAMDGKVVKCVTKWIRKDLQNTPQKTITDVLLPPKKVRPPIVTKRTANRRS